MLPDKEINPLGVYRTISLLRNAFKDRTTRAGILSAVTWANYGGVVSLLCDGKWQGIGGGGGGEVAG